MYTKYNNNNCIYYFKLMYNTLQFFLTLTINMLLFNILPSINNSNNNILLLSLIFMNIRTIISVIVFCIKCYFNKNRYIHTDTDFFLYLLIAFQLCYSLQIIILPGCIDKLWDIVPNSVYFIYTSLLTDIFIGLPILIYHIYLPLFRNSPLENEEQYLLD